MSTYIFQLQSFLILSLLYYGIFQRKNRQKHIKIMGLVMAWDVLLILQIELGREAIDKASRMLANPAILNIHVALAVACVLLYLAQIFTGRKLLLFAKGRCYHRIMGISTVVLRTLVFITSFFAKVH